MRRVTWGLVLGLLALPSAAAQETVEYYHLDALGSVRAVTNQGGAVVRRHDYFPFGEEYLTQSGADNRRFTGKARDGETGLDYFGARYYASQTGRFTTVDPGHVNGDIFDPQSWNAYAYARNNPLKYTDPTGTEYEICAYGASGGASCGSVSDQYFAILSRNPGAGIRLWGGAIFAGDKAVGYYNQTSVDPTFNDFVRLTGDLSSRWLREQSTQMAVGAAIAATGGLAAGAFSGGLAMESSLSILNGPISNALHHIFGKAAHNLGPLVARFGSQEAAFTAVRSATQAAVRARSITGVFETTVRVGGQSVVVRGNVINGAVRIATFFIP